MRIGMLGTGVVGRTLTARLEELGHDVKVGSRDPERSFADAAEHGELVVNATAGSASMEALAMVGASHLAGKVLLDVANPQDFSKGFPPSLSVCNTDSLAEQIQRAYPGARDGKSQTQNLKSLSLRGPALFHEIEQMRQRFLVGFAFSSR